MDLTDCARRQGMGAHPAYRWSESDTLAVPGEPVESEVGSEANGRRPKVRRLLSERRMRQWWWSTETTWPG
jgi:hypothetical protein